MSWNISIVGHRAAVKAKVNAEPHLPKALKAAIVEIIDDVMPHSASGVKVESHGHFGGGYSSIGKCEVMSCNVELDAPAPPAAPPADNEHVAPGATKFGG